MSNDAQTIILILVLLIALALFLIPFILFFVYIFFQTSKRKRIRERMLAANQQLVGTKPSYSARIVRPKRSTTRRAGLSRDKREREPGKYYNG